MPLSADLVTYDFDAIETSVVGRAQTVRASLLKIKDSIEDNFFDLCELLLEAQEGDYHVVWGFGRFGEWIEQSSDLDISARQAYYYVNIAKKTRELGLTREMIKQAKISKLKEIFSLEPSEHAEEMRLLVAAAATESLEEVKSRVRALQAGKGIEPKIFITLKLDASIKETIERAIELARKNYGDVVVGSDVIDASISQCLELICVSYMQDPNNTGEV